MLSSSSIQIISLDILELCKMLTFSFRDHLIICKCRRCEDPSELGSYMSALKCPKCDDTEGQETNRNPFAQELKLLSNSTTNKSGWILPKSPLDFNSTWSCSIHRGIQVWIDLNLLMTLSKYILLRMNAIV